MTLEAKNITFRYGKGERYILNQFNICLEQNQRVGLFAPSGFGKTTLCKMLAGYEQPDEGEVLLDGRPLRSYKGYCPVQMIWQHPELVVNPRMRMKDVLAEGDGVQKRVLDGLGIEDGWLQRFPRELSGGEMQRFCIARALGAGTRFLLCDEISTMLDLITQAQIWRFLIEELQSRNIGMLAVSHSQALLEQICGNNVLVLSAQAV